MAHPWVRAMASRVKRIPSSSSSAANTRLIAMAMATVWVHWEAGKPVEKHSKSKSHEHKVEKHAKAEGKTEVKPEAKPVALAPAAK